MIVIELIGSVAALSMSPSADAQPQAPATAQTQAVTDEEAIRRIDEEWVRLVKAKDAAAVARLYAENGVLMPPNSLAAVGTAAIQRGWQGMFGMPGFGLTFKPDEIVVSKAGDMAYDRGTYEFTATPPSGAINDHGKYVVVWRKTDGNWRVVADIFNSDMPAH